MSAIQPWQGTDEVSIPNLNTKNVIIGNTNQSIDGIKTFENFPLSLSLYPTNPYHFATKAYVDLIGGGGGSIVTQLPDLTDVDDAAFIYTQYNVLSANFTDSKFYSRTADAANLVDKSSAQTLTGKKTFNISTPANWPIVSNAAVDPPSDEALATKKYVDDNIGGGAFVTLDSEQTITGKKIFSGADLLVARNASGTASFEINRNSILSPNDVIGYLKYTSKDSTDALATFINIYGEVISSTFGDLKSDIGFTVQSGEGQTKTFEFTNDGYIYTPNGFKTGEFSSTQYNIFSSNGVSFIPRSLDSSNIVDKSSVQTLTGKKTFDITTPANWPIVSNAATPPPSDAALATKKYVDDNIGAGGASELAELDDVTGPLSYTNYNLLSANGTVFISRTPDTANLLTKNGSQTITGIKTFDVTTWPVVSNSATVPTSDGAFATKKYVDDEVAGVGGGASTLGELTDVYDTLAYTNYNLLSANGTLFTSRTPDQAGLVNKYEDGQIISGQKVFTNSGFTEFRGNIYISKSTSGALPAGTIAGAFDIYGVDDQGYLMEFGYLGATVVNSSHATPRSRVDIYVSASVTPNYYRFDENGYFIAPIGFKTGLSNPANNNILSSNGTGFISRTLDQANVVDKSSTQTITGQKTFENTGVYVKNPNVFNNGQVLSTLNFIDNILSQSVYTRASIQAYDVLDGSLGTGKLVFLFPRSGAIVPGDETKFVIDENYRLSCMGIKINGAAPSGQILVGNGTIFTNNTLDGAGIVDKTSNQTVGGVKTFTSIPTLPGSDPISSNQAVRKAYVDALIGSGGASSLSELSDVNDLLSYTNYNVLQANGTLFVSRSLDAGNIVDKSSNQEINGTKNFISAIPYLPNANPTDNNHAVRKFYVDQQIAGVGGGADSLPELNDVANTLLYTNNNVLAADGTQFVSRTPDSNNLVDKSSTQTIAGVKTFSSIPIIPLTDPTSLQHVTNKNYVDNKFNSITGSFVTTNTDQTITGRKTFDNQYVNLKQASTLTPLLNFMRSYSGDTDLPINSVLGAMQFTGRLGGSFRAYCYNYSMLVSTASNGTGRFYIALTTNGVMDFETYIFNADGTAVAKNSWTTFTGSHLYQSKKNNLQMNSAVILQDDGTIDYTNVSNDRRFIGIIVLKKDECNLYNRDGKKIKDSLGKPIKKGNSVYVVAAVGDCLTKDNSGARVVGSIDNGDSLCTSNIEGCLMRQPDHLNFRVFIEGRAMIARQTIKSRATTEESVIYATFVN